MHSPRQQKRNLEEIWKKFGRRKDISGSVNESQSNYKNRASCIDVPRRVLETPRRGLETPHLTFKASNVLTRTRAEHREPIVVDDRLEAGLTARTSLTFAAVRKIAIGKRAQRARQTRS